MTNEQLELQIQTLIAAVASLQAQMTTLQMLVTGRNLTVSRPVNP